MPSVSNVPLAMAAPMLPMSCARNASPARSLPSMPVSSRRTRSPASLSTRWTSQSVSFRMASSSDTHRIAPLAPLRPTTSRFFITSPLRRRFSGVARRSRFSFPPRGFRWGKSGGSGLVQLRNFPGSTSMKGALRKRSFCPKGTVQSKMVLQPTPRAGMPAS